MSWTVCPIQAASCRTVGFLYISRIGICGQPASRMAAASRTAYNEFPPSSKKLSSSFTPLPKVPVQAVSRSREQSRTADGDASIASAPSSNSGTGSLFMSSLPLVVVGQDSHCPQGHRRPRCVRRPPPLPQGTGPDAPVSRPGPSGPCRHCGTTAARCTDPVRTGDRWPAGRAWSTGSSAISGKTSSTAVFTSR